MSNRIRTLLALTMLVSLLLTPALPASAAGTDGIGPFDVKFAGVITGVPAASGEPWEIGGQTVNADASTRVVLAEAKAAEAGMWADVMAKKQTDGSLLALKILVMSAEMRLVGPLQSMAEAKPGTWTVAGVDLTVDKDTKISERGDPIAVGGWVEVKAVESESGLAAVSIKSVEEREDVEVYGAIQSFSDTEWTLSSVTLAATADTRVMGEPAVGLLAQASAKLQEDGSLLARTVRVAWYEQGGWRQPRQFTGKIEALPPSGLVGVWTVDGQKVDVSAQTKVMQRHAQAEVGATVHVVGFEDGDVVKALLVSVMAPPAGARPFYLVGVIETLPESGLVGTWKVSGNKIQVTAATLIAGQQYAKVGAAAAVLGIQKADGTKTATLVHAKKGP